MTMYEKQVLMYLLAEPEPTEEPMTEDEWTTWGDAQVA